ncbi:MAG: hypothetical protein A3B86_03080 [Candidatus Yanofskybacteria bacterium RIFCSPHIGHO2_02_FULL_38_22b]|uniref:Uncharacterized protein n=1 Tax=Candidatus Yanofskybacteria bacterium RIFCSPHIGHO2_02_FULL_38_22b TaxID=1802673 RepID=A0A1F8F138_9BACT|nr:MAG: hypothetical protein A2816_02675 [Candidatus Yanofskybacteria bacterium RIFCSPHIGHO2_01_FULL_39_44]OGN06854.1 MAG: hypothetical protein A3B86_03080 [Candidatus Yanofskybacteria bacterium RIFCSPHIGHO2_02_FULL_38_22b]OGN20749.1 MAG: hypothetical protein A2910_01040 [Candidatus Yanofskybacteria bacterium RIFCSPLOWO2_01_FULL_39_28]
MKKETPPLVVAPSPAETVPPQERDFLILAIKRKLEEATKDLWELSTVTEDGRDELVADIKILESSVSQLKEKWLKRRLG